MVIQTPSGASRDEGVDNVHITDATYAQGKRTVAGTQTITGNSSWDLLGLDCIPAYLVDKHIGAVQRKMNLRLISGWRTLSRDAANVLSGIPPIRLLALERKEI